MANELKGSISIVDQATANIKRIFKNLGGLGKAFKTVSTIVTGVNQAFEIVGKVFSGIGKIARVIGQAIGFLSDQMSTNIELAIKQENADQRLAAALRNLGDSSARTVQHLKDEADALQLVTTFGNEAIQEVQALLVSLGTLSGEGLERATRTTLDFATALRIDLATAALLIAKAAGGSTAAMSRYGIIIDENIPQSEKFTEVLNLMDKRFGGLAKALTLTFEGRREQIRNVSGDIREFFGDVIIKSPEVIAGLDGIAKSLNTFLTALERTDSSQLMGNITTGLVRWTLASLQLARATLLTYAVVSAPGDAFKLYVKGLAEGKKASEAFTDSLSGGLVIAIDDSIDSLKKIIAGMEQATLIKNELDRLTNLGVLTKGQQERVDALRVRVGALGSLFGDIVQPAKEAKDALAALFEVIGGTSFRDLIEQEKIIGDAQRQLNIDFREGKISAQEYGFELTRLSLILKDIKAQQEVSEDGPGIFIPPDLEDLFGFQNVAKDIDDAHARFLAFSESQTEAAKIEQEERDLAMLNALDMNNLLFNQAQVLDDVTGKWISINEATEIAKQRYKDATDAVQAFKEKVEFVRQVTSALVATTAQIGAELAIGFLMAQKSFADFIRQATIALAKFILQLFIARAITIAIGFGKGGVVPVAGPIPIGGGTLALQEGGFVSGGIRGRDSVPALLTPGEVVLSAPIVERIEQALLGQEGTGGQFVVQNQFNNLVTRDVVEVFVREMNRLAEGLGLEVVSTRVVT